MRSLSMPLPITVVVPIKNEAANLEKCLALLGDFAKVVVVDSGSTDESVAIAERLGAQVIQFQWNGHFPKKRNWLLRSYDFRTPWVLFLDADEYVTLEFISEIARAVQDERFDGYWVTFHNYFMGRLLKHGDTFRKLPLLRLGKGEFEGIDEAMWSSLDMEVHEHLIVDGAVGELKSPILHNDFKGLTAYFDRHNKYSSWEAARYNALSQAERQKFTRRQKIKYGLLHSSVFPILYFAGAYFFKLGFLDGKAGFRFALCKMFYFYQINFKIAEGKSRLAASLEKNNLHATKSQ